MFTLSACAGREAPPFPGDVAFESEQRAEMRWGTPQLSADPLIDVRIGETVSPFVLDTGMSELVLTRVLLERTFEPGSIADNRELQYRIGEDIQYASRLVVIDAPPLEQEGWGGLVSPQRLTDDAVVVMDFVRMRLVRHPLRASAGRTAKACQAVAQRYSQASRRMHKLRWQGRPYGALLVSGRVGDREPVLVDIDSGKAWSIFSTEYMGGTSPIHDGGRIQHADGTVAATVKAPDQVLRIGELVLPGRELHLQASSSPSDDGALAFQGNIGMDILKDAVLVLCPAGDDTVYLGVAGEKR